MSSSKKSVYDDPLIIRFRGEYDYDGLLSLIRGFFARSLFILQEPKFKYKNGGTGAEVEFKFVSDRDITHYIKAHLQVEGHFWDVKRKDGVTNGKLELSISAAHEIDYASDYEGLNLGFDKKKNSHKKLQDYLDGMGTGLQFGDNKVTGEKYLEKLTQKLQKEIKKHLKMECV